VRALLVEDEALVALIAEEILSSLGFEVEVAATGEEALKSALRATPDLAVIDMGLPDIEGDVLAAKVRDAAPVTAILIATGYEPASVREKLLGLSRVEILTKPYTDTDLSAAIGRLGLG